VPYLSVSVVVIHYEEALYQVYGPLPFTFAGITGGRYRNEPLDSLITILLHGSFKKKYLLAFSHCFFSLHYHASCRVY